MKLKNKYITSILAALFTTISFAGVSTIVHADNTSSPTFSVKAILPKDNAKNSSYFDFKMKPNEDKKIQIKINNSDSSDKKFDVIPNNAVTNENGIIDYTKHLSKDKLMKVGLSDVIKPYKNTQISIPAKSSKVITFDLKMPNKTVDGMILGGIRHNAVSDAMKKNNDSKKKQSIVSTYQYVIGIKLTQNDSKISPNVSFNGAKYKVVNNFPSIVVNMQNSAPTITSISTSKATLTNAKGKQVFSRTSSQLNFAPSSSFNYNISLLKQQLDAGTYNFKLVMKNENGQTYNYSKKIVVTAKDVNTVKNHAADFTPKAKTNYTMFYIIGLIALFIIVGLITYIVSMRRKSKKEVENIKKTNKD